MASSKSKFQPHVETLEDRQLMTAQLVSVPIGFGININELRIEGEDRSDVGDDISVNYRRWGRQIVVRERVGDTNSFQVSRFASAQVQRIVFRGYNGDDKFVNNTFKASTAYGGHGNDILIGGFSGDLLQGGPGNDGIFGRAGRDYLFGNAGKDVLFGGDGSDALYGGGGADYLSGGKGSDGLYGGDGDDNLRGGEGWDVLYGNAGNDLYEERSDNFINAEPDDVTYHAMRRARRASRLGWLRPLERLINPVIQTA